MMKSDGKKEKRKRQPKKCERCGQLPVCRNNKQFCHYCAIYDLLGPEMAQKLGAIAPPAQPAQQELFEEEDKR